MVDRYRRLAELTDDEAELCLAGVLKGFTVQNPTYAQALKEPEALADAIRKLATDRGESIGPVGELPPARRPHAVRAILVAVADDQELGARIDAWLTSARPMLVDPITATLVLAGIVMVLSTKFELTVDSKNGKTAVHFSASKAPTPTEILKKFFGFFGK